MTRPSKELYWRGAWRSGLCFGGELTFEPRLDAYPRSILPTCWQVWWKPFQSIGWKVKLYTRRGKVKGWYW